MDGESLKKFIFVDGGIYTHDPKDSMGLSTTPFVKVLYYCTGVLLVGLTTCKGSPIAYPNLAL